MRIQARKGRGGKEGCWVNEGEKVVLWSGNDEGRKVGGRCRGYEDNNGGGLRKLPFTKRVILSSPWCVTAFRIKENKAFLPIFYLLVMKNL